MDDQKQRFSITGEKGRLFILFRLGGRKKEDLNYFADKLDNSNVQVFNGSKSLADQRFVGV